MCRHEKSCRHGRHAKWTTLKEMRNWISLLPQNCSLINNVRLNYLRLPLLLCLIYDTSLCCFNRKFTSLILSHFLLIRCDGKHMNIPDWYCLTLCSLFYEAAFSLLMLFLNTLMVLFDSDNYLIPYLRPKGAPNCVCWTNRHKFSCLVLHPFRLPWGQNWALILFDNS